MGIVTNLMATFVACIDKLFLATIQLLLKRKTLS